jgi:hypothetical protein
MESVSIKDQGGIGVWIMISGCPLPEKHSLFDRTQDLSGPTFAVCACCEFQKGKNFQLFDARGDLPVAAYPEHLRCGYGKRKTV